MSEKPDGTIEEIDGVEAYDNSRSKEITKIATALGKAQAQMTGAKKGTENDFLKSSYSTLSDIIEAIKKPFADNELCFVQFPKTLQNGTFMMVTTTIVHSSGEFFSCDVVLPIGGKKDSQTYGSVITYAKRYGLQALAGVPSIDDDGNDAVDLTPVALITKEQEEAMHEWRKRLDISIIAFDKNLKNKYGITKLKHATIETYEQLTIALKTKEKEQAKSKPRQEDENAEENQDEFGDKK